MKAITFTGGLGAQILSAAAYFYLEKCAMPVSAVLDYFNIPERIAKPGNKGEISIWKWELHHMYLAPDRFNQISLPTSEIIQDGEEKIRLGFLGLKDREIRSYFVLHDQIKDIKANQIGLGSYACVHIRRGDYLNVASLVVDDNDFMKAIEAVSELVPTLLVITDTPLEPEFIDQLRTLQIKTKVIVGGEPIVAHGLMRLSDILICSNSQFSYTAAALREPTKLTMLPVQHDVDLNSPTNQLLGSIKKFQLLTGFA